MKILVSIKTQKGEFGKARIGRKVYFFKRYNIDVVPEVKGYNIIRDKYKLAEMISYDKENKIIIYDYIKDLETKVFHNMLYHKKLKNFDNLIDMLTNPYKECFMDFENNSINKGFFLGRIDYLDDYLKLNNKNQDKKIIIDKVVYPSLNESFVKIKEFINTNPKVAFAITQGDPTDLNFSLSGYMSDFEVSGKNSIINEIAIFLGCFIVNSYYFYIKYVNSAHAKKIKTLKKYKKYINCETIIEEDKILLKSKNFIPKQNKQFILEYLKRIKSLNIIEDKLKFGELIAFRFVNPVRFDKIKNEVEWGLITYLITLFVNKCGTLEEIIKFIEEV